MALLQLALSVIVIDLLIGGSFASELLSTSQPQTRLRGGQPRTADAWPVAAASDKDDAAGRQLDEMTHMLEGRIGEPSCPPGYVDKTNGKAYWWHCGKDCPGGARTDSECACACVHPWEITSPGSASSATTAAATTAAVTTTIPAVSTSTVSSSMLKNGLASGEAALPQEASSGSISYGVSTNYFNQPRTTSSPESSSTALTQTWVVLVVAISLSLLVVAIGLAVVYCCYYFVVYPKQSQVYPDACEVVAEAPSQHNASHDLVQPPEISQDKLVVSQVTAGKNSPRPSEASTCSSTQQKISTNGSVARSPCPSEASGRSSSARKASPCPGDASTRLKVPRKSSKCPSEASAGTASTKAPSKSSTGSSRSKSCPARATLRDVANEQTVDQHFQPGTLMPTRSSSRPPRPKAQSPPKPSAPK